MKKRFIMAGFAFVMAGTPEIYGQQELLPIDSMYLHSVETFYAHALEHKAAIWPGMTLGPVCLYRHGGPAILYNHPQPPATFLKLSGELYLGTQKELDLYGNTITDIDGILTAIVDYGSPEFGSKEEVFSVLFHELHHVYQRNAFPQLRFDNPAMLMTYPENVTNDARKHYEHRLLYSMAFAPEEQTFRDLLGLYYGSRKEREQLTGAYAQYERDVESVEGPAAYTEYMFYRTFDHIPKTFREHYAEKNFWTLLTNPGYGRQNLRARHLVTGYALCYILDRFAGNWKEDYYGSGMDLFGFFVSVFNPVSADPSPHDDALDVYLALSHYHTNKLIAERQEQLDSFYAQPGTQLILDFQSFPGFRGFDPMSAVAVDDHNILHKTMLHLARGENRLFVVNTDALAVVRDVVWNVDRVVLFVPAGQLEVESDRIRVFTENLQLSWRGNLVKQDNTTIEFHCD